MFRLSALPFVHDVDSKVPFPDDVAHVRDGGGEQLSLVKLERKAGSVYGIQHPFHIF